MRSSLDDQQIIRLSSNEVAIQSSAHQQVFRSGSKLILILMMVVKVEVQEEGLPVDMARPSTQVKIKELIKLSTDDSGEG